MITPIQQAFTKWADEKYGPAPKGAPPQHERYSALFEAYSAGRDAGLGEAVEVCTRQAADFGGVAAGPFSTDFGKHTHNAMAAGAQNCASAIEQLKGKK